MRASMLGSSAIALALALLLALPAAAQNAAQRQAVLRLVSIASALRDEARWAAWYWANFRWCSAPRSFPFLSL